MYWAALEIAPRAAAPLGPLGRLKEERDCIKEFSPFRMIWGVKRLHVIQIEFC
jgi:hypothetical protein